MPSIQLNTTNFGTAQGASTVGSIRLVSGGAANQPGVLQLDAINDSATVTTYRYWTDSSGRMRRASTYPTDQDSSGADVTASLATGSVVNRTIAANTVTPGTMSASAREIFVPINFFSLTQGTDLSNRVVYRNTSVTTLNAGSCFIRFDNAQRVISGSSLTIGIGVSAARDMFTRSFTTSQAAGSITSLTAGSVTTLAASTNLRFDLTTSANCTLTTGQILWFPQKRGAA